MTTHTQNRVARRPMAVLVPAVLLMALGAWVFFAPLVGPYFSFGFDTSTHWRFSQDHVLMSLIPGIAIFVGGILMVTRSRAVAWLAALLAVAGGVWLVIGPSLHQTWSTTGFQPMAGGSWKTGLRWIAYFYGAGVLAVYLGAQAQGLLERATVTAEMSAPAASVPPGPYRMTRQTGTPPQRPESDQRQPASSHNA
jgi:hypothetical protein